MLSSPILGILAQKMRPQWTLAYDEDLMPHPLRILSSLGMFLEHMLLNRKEFLFDNCIFQKGPGT